MFKIHETETNRVKGKIGKSIIRVGTFNTPFSGMIQLIEVSKEIEESTTLKTNRI